MREPVGEPYLRRLAISGADPGRSPDVLGGGSAIVLDGRSGQAPKVVYKSKTRGVWRSGHG